MSKVGRASLFVLGLTALGVAGPLAGQVAQPGTHLGALRLGAAYGRYDKADEGGIGGNIGFTAVVAGGRLSVGPEVGRYGLGRNARTVRAFCPADAGVAGPCTLTDTLRESALEVGGVVVLEPWPGRLVAPYALGSLALDSWRSHQPNQPTNSLEMLGYGLGAGLRVGPGLGPAALLEARWHGRASNGADTDLAGFFTLGVGLRYGW